MQGAKASLAPFTVLVEAILESVMHHQSGLLRQASVKVRNSWQLLT